MGVLFLWNIVPAPHPLSVYGLNSEANNDLIVRYGVYHVTITRIVSVSDESNVQVQYIFIVPAVGKNILPAPPVISIAR